MKDTELVRSKDSGVDAVTYSFSNLVRCECHAWLISMISTNFSRHSFDVVNCLLK